MDVIFHPYYLEHEQKGTHPERPDRLIAILDRLEKEDLTDGIHFPKNPDIEKIFSVHTEGYVEGLKEMSPGYIDGGDTYLGDETFDISLLAAEGAFMATRMAEEGKPTMALLRPPGHHAGKNYGGGFCYFNNIAIAAKICKAQKVAILDFDAHHGNGTSDIFYNDPSVLYVSAHHHGIYPGTGEYFAIGDGPGQGYNVNIPFFTGVGDTSMDLAMDKLIEPILRQFAPEHILVSLGTDGHYEDMMTGLSYSSHSYIKTAEKCLKLAKELCSSRISFMLEGGYHLGSLSEIIAGVVNLTEEQELDLIYNEVHDQQERGSEPIKDTRDTLKKYWKLR